MEIPKVIDHVKENTGVCKYTSVTLLAKKGLWQNSFFDRFLRGNVNTPGCQKRASKALHSRILNPIFVQSEVVIPEIQNSEKNVLHCNGFFAAICVNGHKINARYFSKTLQSQTYILPNLAFGFYIGTV